MWRDVFTERDNKTYCILRIFGLPFAIVGSTEFFYLAWVSVMHLHNAFDAVAYGTGASAVWLVYAAAIIGKAHLAEDRT